MYYQSSKFDLFRHFWPQVTFITSWHLSSESLRQERHFYTLESTFNDFWNLTYFRNFWPQATFVALVTFFENLTSKLSFWQRNHFCLTKNILQLGIVNISYLFDKTMQKCLLRIFFTYQKWCFKCLANSLNMPTYYIIKC